MMPLWTTLIWFLQSVCGCAFSSVTPPCVLHLQCASPVLPVNFRKLTFLLTSSSFPTPFCMLNPLLFRKHIPTESYPLYSRFERPLNSFSLTPLPETTPMIPHITIHINAPFKKFIKDNSIFMPVSELLHLRHGKKRNPRHWNR